MRVMVLAGGPDRERPVSLQSGESVAEGLGQAGHDVRLRDVSPHDLTALEEWAQWGGDVIFPVLHGPWGEGGPLQEILNKRQIPYVGSQNIAARLCMDKHATKLALLKEGLATPEFEVLTRDGLPSKSSHITALWLLSHFMKAAVLVWRFVAQPKK